MDNIRMDLGELVWGSVDWTGLAQDRDKWRDNIRMDLGELIWGSVDWIGLGQDSEKWRGLVNVVMNLGVP
jgi:hypothetical protein